MVIMHIWVGLLLMVMYGLWLVVVLEGVSATLPPPPTGGCCTSTCLVWPPGPVVVIRVTGVNWL